MGLVALKCPEPFILLVAITSNRFKEVLRCSNKEISTITSKKTSKLNCGRALGTMAVVARNEYDECHQKSRT